MTQAHKHTFITKRYYIVNVHWDMKVCDGGIDLIRAVRKWRKNY